MFDNIFRRKMLIFISFDPNGRFNENLSKENGYTLMEAGIKETLDLAGNRKNWIFTWGVII